eukprot:m.171858 g.171858  ORF g.171858 m.171858 type:complete len:589 (-) comp16508_c1_seq2:461-2227(-)
MSLLRVPAAPSSSSSDEMARRRGVSAPASIEWLVQFDEPTEANTQRHVSAHKGKYPDELVDNYSVGYTIGDGGFSKVKLARHRMTGIKVAIKMISKDILQQQGELFRAANEIAALQLLKHQNIARLFQVLESKSRVYLVMEHMPAGELFDYIVAQGRLKDEDMARNLYRQIVAAVAHAHHEGFAHRDIKPENMLFDEKKVLKLIDFGLVAMPGTTQKCKTSCGSANYAAPEVIRGESYDGSCADMWSLGIVLYAMLCGCLPFDDPDLRVLGSLIRKGVYAEPPFLSSGAKDLIRKLLTMDPAKRMKMDELLCHPWITKGLAGPKLDISSTISTTELDEQVISVLATYYGVSEDRVRHHLEADPYDHVTADYELVCLAKAKRMPLRLVEGAGIFNPRELPDIEIESPDEDDLSPDAGHEMISVSNASSALSTPAVSRSESPRIGRRRGLSESIKPGDSLKIPMPTDPSARNAGWLSAKFNSMRTLAQPLIVHDSNLGINYKTETDADSVREELYSHLCNLPGEVRIKNRMFRLDVLLKNEYSDNQEIRLHFEIVRIVNPPLTGIRVSRVKGDRAQVQKACVAIFNNFKI